MMSLWDALRMNMMISYQELVRTFPKYTGKHPGGLYWFILCRFLFEYRLAGFYRLRYGGFGYENLSHCLFYYK